MFRSIQQRKEGNFCEICQNRRSLCVRSCFARAQCLCVENFDTATSHYRLQQVILLNFNKGRMGSKSPSGLFVFWFDAVDGETFV